MTQTNIHEYSYPYNGYVTQVLTVRDFSIALVQHLQEERAHSKNWSARLEFHRHCIHEMVSLFEFPATIAEQLLSVASGDVIMNNAPSTNSDIQNASVQQQKTPTKKPKPSQQKPSQQKKPKPTFSAIPDEPHIQDHQTGLTAESMQPLRRSTDFKPRPQSKPLLLPIIVGLVVGINLVFILGIWISKSDQHETTGDQTSVQPGPLPLPASIPEPFIDGESQSLDTAPIQASNDKKAKETISPQVNHQTKDQQAMMVLSALQRQAAELNIEPASEKNTALYLLQELDDLAANHTILARAHFALQNGYEALSTLSKARGQSIQAQTFQNKAHTHATAANTYERSAK